MRGMVGALCIGKLDTKSAAIQGSKTKKTFPISIRHLRES